MEIIPCYLNGRSKNLDAKENEREGGGREIKHYRATRFTLVIMEKERRAIYEELHRTARVRYPRRRFEARDISDFWQSDLIDMQNFSRLNKGYRYILVVVNVFSKYAYVEPLKTKAGSDVTEAFEKILKRAEPPRNLLTDQGLEYYNKQFKRLTAKYKINHYSTFSGMKASIAERFNLTFKRMLYKNFSLKGRFEWLSDLQKLVNEYNDTKHSTIKMKPSEVTHANEGRIKREIYPYVVKETSDKFRVGDKVRISKTKRIFDKSYHPNWSYEVFKIHKKLNTRPTTYVLKNSRNEVLDGGFYEFELMKTKIPDVFLIEKILRRKGNKKFVKWVGHDSSYNSWI